MLEEKIKRRLARRLQNSRVRQLIAREIVDLLSEKPDETPTEEYCLSVAEIVVGELKDHLCGSMLEDAVPEHPPDPVTESEPTPDLNAVIRRLTTGVEKALLSGNLQMLRALGEAIAQRDTGNSKHNLRVTLFAILAAEAMELESENIQALIKGSFLHDIGKIGIRDDIILKPAGLSEEERMIMDSHTILGENMIKGVRWLDDAREVVRSHHEWFDGSGYPDGLKGKAIPLNARLFGIVDVFDALISERPYKEGYSFDRTMQYIFDRRGVHFDPWIAESFANISRQLYDELAWEPYHALDQKLRKKVADHFGLDVPSPTP
jgi:putative nucleotidyltransferase with HDIG domain